MQNPYLPAGCANAMIDALSAPDPSDAQAAVQAILDSAGFSKKFVDSIVEQISDEEAEIEEARRDDARWERDHDR